MPQRIDDDRLPFGQQSLKLRCVDRRNAGHGRRGQSGDVRMELVIRSNAEISILLRMIPLPGKAKRCLKTFDLFHVHMT